MLGLGERERGKGGGVRANTSMIDCLACMKVVLAGCATLIARLTRALPHVHVCYVRAWFVCSCVCGCVNVRFRVHALAVSCCAVFLQDASGGGLYQISFSSAVFPDGEGYLFKVAATVGGQVLEAVRVLKVRLF